MQTLLISAIAALAIASVSGATSAASVGEASPLETSPVRPHVRVRAQASVTRLPVSPDSSPLVRSSLPASSAVLEGGRLVHRWRAGLDLAPTDDESAPRLRCDVEIIGVDGHAHERATIADGALEEGMRRWHGTGGGLSVGYAWEYRWEPRRAIRVEAGGAYAGWAGPLEQWTRRTDAATTLRWATGGTATGGWSEGHLAVRVVAPWGAGELSGGIGWVQHERWSRYVARPAPVLVRDEASGSEWTMYDRSQRDDVQVRWHGLVLPVEVRWPLGSRASATAGGVAWWAARSGRLEDRLAVAAPGQLPYEPEPLVIESRERTVAWAWRVGFDLGGDDQASWHLGASSAGCLTLGFATHL